MKTKYIIISVFGSKKPLYCFKTLVTFFKLLPWFKPFCLYVNLFNFLQNCLSLCKNLYLSLYSYLDLKLFISIKAQFILSWNFYIFPLYSLKCSVTLTFLWNFPIFMQISCVSLKLSLSLKLIYSRSSYLGSKLSYFD